MAIDLQATALPRILESAAAGLPGGRASEPRRRRFAHPAESLLANLLSFHGIAWEYEPTNFVLRRTADGEIAESFTPDFFLPEHGHFLELTTMRQPLVTRKNGKIRRLRELYPEVSIRTLYRRDYERILETSRRRDVHPKQASRSVVYSAGDVAARIEEIAGEIARSLHASSIEHDSLVLATTRPEASAFRRRLAEAMAGRGYDVEQRCLDLPRFDPVDRERRIAIQGESLGALRGRAVLVVTGAVSTGLSLAFALRRLADEGVAWLEATTLIDRASARVIDATVGFACFDAPQEFLTGFGLSIDDAGGAIVRDISFEPRLDERAT